MSIASAEMPYDENVEPHRHRADESVKSRPVFHYVRVSSKEQAEGFSITAQLRLLNEYAQANSLELSAEREFIEAESAKQGGRPAFGEMIQALSKLPPDQRVVLTEKADRLYRNFEDRAIIDALKITLVLARQGKTLTPDSDPAEWLAHDIETVVAKHFVASLRLECRKGSREKARQGVWPSVAPIGYQNVAEEGVGRRKAKKWIEPDPVRGPLITQLFERYLHGDPDKASVGDTDKPSITDLVEWARSQQLTPLRSKKPITKSTVHRILRSTFYYGVFTWDGIQYEGSHTPLVDRDTWDAVQRLMDEKAILPVRRQKWTYAYSRFLTCGECGCAVVGERKKAKYTYYRCTHGRGACDQGYVKEELIEKQMMDSLRSLALDRDMATWMTATLRHDHSKARDEREAAIHRLEARRKRLQGRIDKSYEDRLDGKIDTEMFERLTSKWHKEIEDVLLRIQAQQDASEVYLDEGIAVLELAGMAADLYENQDGGEKRRLLGFLLSNCKMIDGRISPVFRKPFDLVVDAARKGKEKRPPGEDSEGPRPVWYTR